VVLNYATVFHLFLSGADSGWRDGDERRHKSRSLRDDKQTTSNDKSWVCWLKGSNGMGG
jgi:hypothetical protein